jgi:hypothetical protein
MQDPNFYIVIAVTSLAAVAMLTAAMLAGWRGWLSLKRHELAIAGDNAATAAMPSASQRIEVADLKERIRKLEAIAAGVDL